MRESVLRFLCLRRPRGLAALRVERDELAVELADEDLAAPGCDAPVRPAAAHRFVVRVEVRVVVPQRGTRVDADREHVVRSGRDVHDAVDDERLRLARVLRSDTGAAEPSTPYTLELGDVRAVDLRQRRVAPVIPIAAVRGPADGRRRDVLRVACGLCERMRCESGEQCAGRERRSCATTQNLTP